MFALSIRLLQTSLWDVVSVQSDAVYLLSPSNNRVAIYSFTFACYMLKLLHSKMKECVTDCSPDHKEYLSICQIPINLNDRSHLQNYGDVMLLSIKFTISEKVRHKEQCLPTNFICFMIGITNFVP